MADDTIKKARAQKKKDEAHFGGSFTDMGSKHATGMGHDHTAHPELRDNKNIGFGGTFTDMGAKDAVGVGEGK